MSFKFEPTSRDQDPGRWPIKTSIRGSPRRSELRNGARLKRRGVPRGGREKKRERRSNLNIEGDRGGGDRGGDRTRDIAQLIQSPTTTHILIRDQPRLGAILQAAVARLHKQYIDQDTLQGRVLWCWRQRLLSDSLRRDRRLGERHRLRVAVIVAARLLQSCFGVPSGAASGTIGQQQRRRWNQGISAVTVFTGGSSSGFSLEASSGPGASTQHTRMAIIQNWPATCSSESPPASESEPELEVPR